MAPCSTFKTDVHDKALRWPWVIFFLATLIFSIPWIVFAIFVRYWVEKDWEAALVGLDDNALRRVTMVGHMTMGAVTMIIGPLQFIRGFRSRFPTLHRWCGRAYVLCALATALMGFIFIFAKRFVLVGGINMGIAFFVAGIVFAFCALKVPLAARSGDIHSHRQWAIRSYSQCIAPMLYRYFYTILIAFGFEAEVDTEEGCNDEDICEIFVRPFDTVHCWTYWIFPLVVAEILARSIPREKIEAAARKDSHKNALEENDVPGGDEEHYNESADSQRGSFLQFNLIAMALAGASLISTATIYILGFLG